MKENINKNKQEKEQVHIIRRQVKVIKTEEEPTKAKSLQEQLKDMEPRNNRSQNNNRDTDRRRNNNNNTGSNKKFLNNRNTNVVIMKNGKIVEEDKNKEKAGENNIEVKKEKVVKEVVDKKDDVKPNVTESNSQNREGGYRGNRDNNGGGFQNREGGYRGNRDNNNSQNREGGYRGNRDNNNNSQNREGGYRGNRDNNGGFQNREGGYRGNRDNNNSQNREGGYRGNRDNNGGGFQNREGGYRGNRDNNGGGFQNREGGYRGNRDNNNSQNREGGYRGNRDNNGGGFQNREGGYRGNGNSQNREGGYRGNNQNREGGYRGNNSQNRDRQGSQNGGNTSYQVNKFIKAASAQPLEQKDTRDYQSSILDKTKHNSYEPKQADKKEKKNKNLLREQHSRVDLGSIKGLELDSQKSMIDLYERNSDRIRKNRRSKKQKPETQNQTLIIPMTKVELPEVMSVKQFAEAMKKQASEIIKKLFGLGILATVNQEIDFDTAFIIAEEYGITAEKQVIVTEEDILFDDSEDDDTDLVERPPVVAVMGHVDHGKTSLLDRIRSENVQSAEAGGITQHIGAYKVKVNNKEIAFLDTPGHEAFTAMRARGAQVTDIAIIVVAADDGIMPQTVEAINHAKAAGVSIIVAINKMDKADANPDKVKQELLEAGLVPEEWGGDTICVPVSAMSGDGIDTLLEMILLVAEVKDLKTNPVKQAKGTVIESRLDNKKGTIASLLVQRGQLNVGDTIVVGDVIGKIRAMVDDKGKKVKVAGPSTPVEILGLPTVPNTGEVFYEVENEKVAKQLVEKRRAQLRKGLIKEGSQVTLDDLFSQIKQGEVKDLNVIIKADVQGSVQAITESLLKLSNDEVRVRIIHSAAGAISESDITLASVSSAIIIGFNVRPDARISTMAEKEKVDLRLYRVIYDAINDVEAALKGMLKPIFREQFHGTAEIRNIFKVTGAGTIAGCYVKQGKVIRNGLIRVVRDGIVIAEDKIESLKRMKDDAKEVAEGYECGIKLEKFNDIKNTDILECFEMIEEERK